MLMRCLPVRAYSVPRQVPQLSSQIEVETRKEAPTKPSWQTTTKTPF